MTDILHSIAQLDRKVCALHEKMELDIPAYQASALYLPSSERAQHAFAISSYNRHLHERRRSDRLVHRRLLSHEHSSAVRMFSSQKPSVTLSTMFPREHVCTHLPITLNTQTQGVMQFVFARDELTEGQCDLAETMMQVTRDIDLQSNVVNLNANRVDHVFGVRMPYEANSVVILCDVQGTTQLSEQVGGWKMQDMMNDFACFIEQFSERFETNLLRVEGDGAWLSVPISTENMRTVQRQQAVKDDVTHIVRSLYQEFQSFSAAQYQYDMKGVDLRIIVELGEIDDMRPGYVHPAVGKHVLGGPVMTYMKEAEKRMKVSQKTGIFFGPDFHDLGCEDHDRANLYHDPNAFMALSM